MKLRGLKWTKVKLEDWNEIWKKLEGQFCILVTIIIKLSMKKKISLMSPFCWERHRTETHTQGSGNSGLIWHNSQHTKVGNSWILCEGFKPIGRHTLGQCGTNLLNCFFWERHKIETHTLYLFGLWWKLQCVCSFAFCLFFFYSAATFDLVFCE